MTNENNNHGAEMLTSASCLVLVDLEATCWEKDPPHPNETIEIGAVAWRPGRGAVDEFTTFVRPKLAPVLTEFCRALTTIKQEDVDTASGFPEALAAFLSWTKPYSPLVMVSWGNYDHEQLRQDCVLHGIEYPISAHANLKQVYSDVTGTGRCGMKRALRRAGLAMTGTHHRGIDDARNLVSLVEYLLTRMRSEGAA